MLYQRPSTVAVLEYPWASGNWKGAAVYAVLSESDLFRLFYMQNSARVGALLRALACLTLLLANNSHFFVARNVFVPVPLRNRLTAGCGTDALPNLDRSRHRLGGAVKQSAQLTTTTTTRV